MLGDDWIARDRRRNELLMNVCVIVILYLRGRLVSVALNYFYFDSEIIY